MEQAYHDTKPREHRPLQPIDLAGPEGTYFTREANMWNALLQAKQLKLRWLGTNPSTCDDSRKAYPYRKERITTPFTLRRAARRAGFTAVQSRNFRMLPNSNPPHWWRETERALLSIAPVISTHFNVVGTRS